MTTFNANYVMTERMVLIYLCGSELPCFATSFSGHFAGVFHGVREIIFRVSSLGFEAATYRSPRAAKVVSMKEL